MKNKTFLIVMLIFLSTLCLGNLCLGLWTIVPKMFVDFPCFVTYDQTRQCIVGDMMYMPESAAISQDNIQVFLTTSYLGFSGGGCDYEHTADKSTQVDTPAGKFIFERKGNILLVNDREIAVGETYRHINYLVINPWVEYYIEFTNYGVVNFCDSDVPPRLVVIGYHGSSVSLLKAIPFFLVVFAAVITFAILLIRALRQAKKPKSPEIQVR